MMDMKRVGYIIGASIAGSVIGLVYGGVFWFVLIRLMTDSSETLRDSIVFAAFGHSGWSAGAIVGGVAGLLVTQKGRSSA